MSAENEQMWTADCVIANAIISLAQRFAQKRSTSSKIKLISINPFCPSVIGLFDP